MSQFEAKRLEGTLATQSSIHMRVRKAPVMPIRKQTSKNYKSEDVYQGVEDERSFHIMQGDVILGMRETDSTDAEIGFASLSGLPFGNREALMREFYPVGVSLVEVQEDDDDFGVLKFGPIQMPANNGPKTIFGGQLVAVQAPNPKKMRHIYGTGSGKVPPQLVPFDHSDVGMHPLLVCESVTSKEENWGIAQFTFEDYTNPDAHEYMSTHQEEAMGIAYGEMLKAARVIEAAGEGDATANRKTALEYLKGIGLFRKNSASRTQGEMELWHQRLCQILGVGENGKVNEVTENQLDDPNLTEDNKMYERHVGEAAKMAQVARDGAFMTRASTVVGKALKTSRPGEPLDLLYGLVNVAF